MTGQGTVLTADVEGYRFFWWPSEHRVEVFEPHEARLADVIVTDDDAPSYRRLLHIAADWTADRYAETFDEEV